MKSKWQISKMEEKERKYTDAYAAEYYDDFTEIQDRQKIQNFINTSKQTAVKEMSIQEIRNFKSHKLEARTIHVQFGILFSQNDLNKIFGKRKLDQITEKEYKEGACFKANTHTDVVKWLSTLHQISLFSKEMKKAIVDYLGSKMDVDQKKSLENELFSKYSKVPSLFDLCLHKINEDTKSFPLTEFEINTKLKI